MEREEEMKTETQIAKENIFLDKTLDKLCSKEHKSSCQRFLEFLNIHDKQDYRGCGSRSFVEEKITDLKQAIKLYEENGI